MEEKRPIWDEPINQGKKSYREYVIAAYGPSRASEILKKKIFTTSKKDKESPEDYEETL